MLYMIDVPCFLLDGLKGSANKAEDTSRLLGQGFGAFGQDQTTERHSCEGGGANVVLGRLQT